MINIQDYLIDFQRLYAGIYEALLNLQIEVTFKNCINDLGQNFLQPDFENDLIQMRRLTMYNSGSLGLP